MTLATVAVTSSAQELNFVYLINEQFMGKENAMMSNQGMINKRKKLIFKKIVKTQVFG